MVVALGGNDTIAADWYKDAQGDWHTYMTTAQNVRICAGDGDDDDDHHVYLGGHIDAGPGKDYVTTDDEKDWIDFGDNGSVVYGGPGNDWIEAGANSVVHGGSGDDQLTGTMVFGDGGNDTMTGTTCSGGAGNDTGDCDTFYQ